MPENTVITIVPPQEKKLLISPRSPPGFALPVTRRRHLDISKEEEKGIEGAQGAR